MHGLPASSFLYRKVLPELAARGLRGVALDLPGLGLADRPEGFDATVDSLGRWLGAAIDVLGLDRYHLVVHDAGGPVGLTAARSQRARVRSITVLDTVLQLGRVPFPGELYAHLSGRMRGPMASREAWRALLHRVGVADPAALPDAEADAYRVLTLGPDGSGSGYLAVMKGLAAQRGRLDVRDVVDTRSVPYPVSLVWGALDPILSVRRQGAAALAATGLPSMTVVPGRHYLQEDNAAAIAQVVAATAARA